MASKAKQAKNFQIDFLRFLSTKNFDEVHIYHYVMNYWSNDSSSIGSLQLLKDAITDLCDKKYIVSKDNAHLQLGMAGISEDDQKNNALCTILDAGRSYLKKKHTGRTLRAIVIMVAVIGIACLLWHFRPGTKYLFK
ncbi:MAG: hypothetical protein JST47_12575 [Bacteroidetes bacterium]|nr:hypothetical protein [Bacteroidota bacterium]